MTKTETPISTAASIPVSGKEFTLVAPTKKTGQSLGISIDRTGWTDDAQRLTVVLVASLDGGKTWRDWSSYTDQGGVQLGPKGETLLASSYVATPPPAGALLKVRAAGEGKAVSQSIAFVEVS